MKLIKILIIVLSASIALTGCKPSSGTYEKLIMEEAEDGGVWGKFPARYSIEEGLTSLPLLPSYKIVEFNDINVISFSPIVGMSKEEIKNTDTETVKTLFTQVPENCIFSVLNALPAGTAEGGQFEDPTAVLAEVSIAKMEPLPLNKNLIGDIKINDEYLNETKSAWFIVCTSPKTFVAFACFEDEDYFDNLVGNE